MFAKLLEFQCLKSMSWESCTSVAASLLKIQNPSSVSLPDSLWRSKFPPNTVMAFWVVRVYLWELKKRTCILGIHALLLARPSFQNDPLGSLRQLKLLSAAGCGKRVFTAAGRCNWSFVFLRSKSPFQTRLSRCSVWYQAESLFWNHRVNFQSEEKGLWNEGPRVCSVTKQEAPVGQIGHSRDSP